ncbi:MAG: hypothetical protein PUC06_11105 [Oscillospiraceae bacterium]|nr:hypothetical protein [Oscillospiraceae bacterium]
MGNHNTDPHRYDHMLDLPHPVSRKHPPMNPISRAAQFSPFAALTGFDDEIASTWHHRCNRIQLSDEEMTEVNQVLGTVRRGDSVTITWFRSDPGTDGSGGFAEGEYRTLSGQINRMDPVLRALRLGTGEEFWDIDFQDILVIRKTE